MRLISTFSPKKSSGTSLKLSPGTNSTAPPPEEVLFIYQIFMENFFNLFPSANLLPSFMKRKIKIFKNSKN